jgi:hypothetical protein
MKFSNIIIILSSTIIGVFTSPVVKATSELMDRELSEPFEDNAEKRQIAEVCRPCVDGIQVCTRFSIPGQIIKRPC